MSKNASSLAQYARFGVIESLLRWEGEVSNRRLRQVLGLQAVAASRLIAAYRARYPRAIEEHTRKKRFVPTPHFTLHCARGTLTEYEQLTRGAPAREIEDARLEIAQPDEDHFAHLLQAVRFERWVKLTLLRQNRPESLRARPLRLVAADPGWFLRAWVESAARFELISLAQVTKVTPDATSTDSPVPEDDEWEERLTLRLQIHQDASPEEEARLRRTFFKGAAGRRLEVRAALAPILLQHLRIALRPDEQRPPAYQFELANLNQLKGRLSELLKKIPP
jgi:hypothetical protein